MVRKLAAALLGVGVLIPGLANALGLGEIKLNSALSEPLDAEIELVQVRELTGTEILPSLATQGDFESAGVERSQFLTDFKFEVIVNEKGKSYIRVRSNKPVKEPFLNFLVEVNWPAGRLLREYTLFLDPPTYSRQRPQTLNQPVAAPAPAPRASVPASRPAPVPSQPERSSEPYSEPAPAAASSGGGADSHTIGANDSLWGIAKDLKPSDDVSIHQTMIALQRANPDAFINDNINLLKKGQVLRAPSVEEAQQVSASDAVALVAEQNRAWRERIASRKGGETTPEARQLDLTGRSLDQEPAPAPTSDEGRLKLLSGTAGEGDSGAGGSEAGSGELRNKLAVAEENVDKFKLENEDLKVKMNDLSDQLKTSEKVLTLKDQQIAALQAKLADLEAKEKLAGDTPAPQPAPAEPAAATPAPAPEAVAPVDAQIEETPSAAEKTQPDVDFNYQEEAKQEEPKTDAAQPEPAAGAPEAPADATPVPETTGEDTAITDAELPEEAVTGAQPAEPGAEPIVVEDKPVTVEQPAQAEPAKPATPPAAEQDLLTQLISNPLYLGIGAGAIVLMLAVGLMGLRRKKAAENEFDNELVDDFQMPDASSKDAVEDLDVDFDEPAEALQDVAEATREETVPQTSDVIGEADIYIAYGRYPQAIEMLQKAAQNEPGRADIHLKLCEVCAEAKEPEIFAAHYQALQSLGDAPSLRRAEELRNRLGLAIPAAAALGGAAASFAAGDETLIAPVTPTAEEDFDFDISESAASTSVALEPESDAGLDFDLGDLEDTGARFAETAPSQQLDQDSGLDFDLSLDEPQASPTTSQSDGGLDFDFDMAVSEPAPVLPVDNASDGLDFDTEFSLDSVEEPVAKSSNLDFESDLTLDFDHVETAQAASPVADDNSLDFDLDFDTGTPDSAPTSLDDDRTIAFTPAGSSLDFNAPDDFSAPDFSAPAEEPSLNAQSAAQLADELDLGGDFLSHEEPQHQSFDEPLSFDADATVQAPALNSDFSFEPAPIAPVPTPVAPSFAANDQIDSGDELDFLADADETSTKLDLARAYIDMGDRDGAKDILDEVLIEGSDHQKQEARDLLNRLEA